MVCLAPIQTVSLPFARSVHPFITSFGRTFLAAAGVTVNSAELSFLYEISLVDQNTDFYSRYVLSMPFSATSPPLFHRNLTLTFRPGETSLFFTAAINNDNLPEVDEDFRIGLSMPSGGARLGEQTSITMTILTNDNAHGLIGFNDASLSILVAEMDMTFIVSLNVDRTEGTFGLVSVQWQLSGGHTAGEISPASGQVLTNDCRDT